MTAISKVSQPLLAKIRVPTTPSRPLAAKEYGCRRPLFFRSKRARTAVRKTDDAVFERRKLTKTEFDSRTESRGRAALRTCKKQRLPSKKERSERPGFTERQSCKQRRHQMTAAGSQSAACGTPRCRAYRPCWRRGRVAEGGGLLNRYRVVKPYRGFESLRLRQPLKNSLAIRHGKPTLPRCRRDDAAILPGHSRSALATARHLPKKKTSRRRTA
jgi:hypothetical protein